MASRKWIVLLAAGFLYIGSYYVVSRLGFQRMLETHGFGFYYMEPSTPLRSGLNRTLCIFYLPAYAIDFMLLGTGRPMAGDPDQFSLAASAGSGSTVA